MWIKKEASGSQNEPAEKGCRKSASEDGFKNSEVSGLYSLLVWDSRIVLFQFRKDREDVPQYAFWFGAKTVAVDQKCNETGAGIAILHTTESPCADFQIWSHFLLRKSFGVASL